jgi:hypothetical protein
VWYSMLARARLRWSSLPGSHSNSEGVLAGPCVQSSQGVNGTVKQLADWALAGVWTLPGDWLPRCGWVAQLIGGGEPQACGDWGAREGCQSISRYKTKEWRSKRSGVCVVSVMVGKDEGDWECSIVIVCIFYLF